MKTMLAVGTAAVFGAATIGCGGGGDGNTSGFKQNTGGAGGGNVISSSGGASQAGGAGPGSGPGAGPGSGPGAGPGSGGSASTSTSTSSAVGGGSGSCNMVFPQPSGAPSGQDWWNTDVSSYPVANNSGAYINYINSNGGDGPLHADFDAVGDGIPYQLVDNSVTKVPVVFKYATESDQQPYPIPASPKIESGSDHHIIMVDTSECKLYELWAAQQKSDGWHAGSGAIFDLTSNALRHDCWTSADAAGLAVYPGLVRFDEVTAGAINHALRFTIQNSRHAWMLPARHEAGCDGCDTAPPMGLRLRLKNNAQVNGVIASAGPQPKVVLTALQKYGMIVADNGSNWYVSGEPAGGPAPKPLWNDGDFHDAFGQIHGGDFEVVDTAQMIETACN